MPEAREAQEAQEAREGREAQEARVAREAREFVTYYVTKGLCRKRGKRGRSGSLSRIT